MSVILCPTRGGKSSIPNQQWAIRLAKERGAQLIFLYVSDVRFLDNLASPLLVDVADELDEMGEFLLGMAQDRARQEGVDAQILVHHGIFREALTEVIRQYQVDTVVIGASTRGSGVTTEHYLAILAARMKEQGVEMMVVDGGRLMLRYAADLDDPAPSTAEA